MIIKSCVSKSLSLRGLILGVLIVIILVSITYNCIFHGGTVVADVKHDDIKGFDNNYTENELSLTYNIDSISKIRFESEWNMLSTSEKLNVLQDICNCEMNYWGMDSKVTIVMDDLEPYTLGAYCDTERRIIIDKQHLEYSDPESILETTLHEMYHAWEHSLVRLYLDSSESQRRLRVFQHCEEYINEMRNYQDGGDDYESFMSYYCQYMEYDSRAYAKEAVKDYYSEIDLILKERSSNNADKKEGELNE